MEKYDSLNKITTRFLLQLTRCPIAFNLAEAQQLRNYKVRHVIPST